MFTSSAVISSFFQFPIRVMPCILLFFCASVPGQERHFGSVDSERTEVNALKVLNDSDWAHTVKPTLQDAPCTYENPAFPDLYPKEAAAALDATSPASPAEPVKADGSEYLIRFESAKPVQTAVEELLALGDKWSAYGTGKREVNPDEGPTDLANARYNVPDMITIVVILKQSGADGASLFDYGFEDNGREFPSHSFRVWPCAGLRTANGQVFARVSGGFGHDPNTKALLLSFPRLIEGKPLISDMREKVDFRLVVNQRVFETTFYINANDVLDGSEKTLYLPSTFTDPKEIARQQP